MATKSSGARTVGAAPRSLRAATGAAIKAARDARRLAAADEPLAVLAVKLAGQFDRAKSTGEMVRLGAAVVRLLDGLPLREPVPLRVPKGGSGGDSDRGDPKPSGIDAELAELTAAGATLGD